MKRGLLILCVVAAAVAVVVVSLWRSRVVNLPGQRTARQVELDEIRDATSNTQRASPSFGMFPGERSQRPTNWKSCSRR